MTVKIIIGDSREVLAGMTDQSVHCCVTSPPYFGLRDYGMDGQIGLEQTPDAYVAEMVALFREVRRVLRDDGTLWLNLGDSYASDTKWGGKTSGKHARGNRGDTGIGRRRTNTGLKQKDLIGIPWRVAFALQADGWYLRQDIIWHKPNPMPESVRDRCTKAHEYIFMLSKSGKPTIWQARDTSEWSSAPDLSELVPYPTEDDPNATRRRWKSFDYFYDADAIKNPPSEALLQQIRDGYDGSDTKDYEGAGAQSASGTKARIIANARAKVDKQRGHGRRHAGFNDRWDAMSRSEQLPLGSNKRSVWTVSTKPFKGAHFATFPPDLIEPCILAGCPPRGVVLDPFGGAGTTGLVAQRQGRNAVLIELNPAYADIAESRLRGRPKTAYETWMTAA